MQPSTAEARGLSSCGPKAQEHRLNSWRTWAQLLHGMWDLPAPGIEPVSSAMAGGFFTLSHQGSPSYLFQSVLWASTSLLPKVLVERMV